MSITKQASSDLKIKAIKYYYKVNNYSLVCKIFECSERSLKRQIEIYEQNKSVERKSRKLGSYKIKKEHIKFIKDTLKNNNDIHIKVLYELLKNKFHDLDISRQYIHDLIRYNNITRMAHLQQSTRLAVKNTRVRILVKTYTVSQSF